jgi:hypothetical protein
MEKKIRLSPSQLNLFKDCSRCFWLHQNQKIQRPRGIFPSLPGEIDGKVEGDLFPDTEVLNKWRNWRTGLNYQDKETGAILVGALDDCLVSAGKYIPLDYKTRGYDPKPGGEMYYQLQLDSYCFLLEVNDLPPENFAYLVYYVPKEVNENGMVKFEIIPKKVPTNTEDALVTFNNAVHTLLGPMPDIQNSCEYCTWAISLTD